MSERISQTERSVDSVFHILCVFAALSMVAYCTFEFIKNEDVAEISYQTFHGGYPDLTLCFDSPFVEEKLRQYGNDLNSSGYGLFLKGDYWDERMLEIDYDAVTLSLDDFLLQTCVRPSYTGAGTDCKNITKIRSFHFRTHKCFSFHPDDDIKTIMSIEIRIKSANVFRNGIRSQRGDFLFHLHNPKQFLRSYSTGMYLFQNGCCTWNMQSI